MKSFSDWIEKHNDHKLIVRNHSSYIIFMCTECEKDNIYDYCLLLKTVGDTFKFKEGGKKHV
uniref:Uncharacterized protein n=1 Tax=viral metagenome TaxID=1070528 RepID=A0A6M3LSG4_9ZZZZ